MAIYKSDIVDINLETCNIHRAFLNRTIGSGDSGADHFGIRVFRNSEPVDLTGVSVQGIFLPPQGSPIAITDGNSVSGNEAYVVLPQACYNYDGQFCLSIKLVGGGVTGTMRIVDGMVDNTHSTGTVAPTETVPTYQEILSTYDDMVAATAAANGAIAKPYAQLTFPVTVGTYTIVDGALKRAIVPIATSETYTAAHWTDAKLGPDVSALKSALQNELLDGNSLDVLKFLNSKTGTHRDVVFTWNEDKSACTVSGKATGGNAVNNMFLRTSGSFPFGIVPGGTYRLKYSATNVKFQVLVYKNNSLDTVIGSIVDREITIPADASGVDIRLFVESGVTASETVYPKLFTTYTTAEIENELKNGNIVKPKGVVTTGTDIDDIITAGCYVLDSANTYDHNPFPGIISELLVFYASNNTKVQVAYSQSRNEIKYRVSRLGVFPEDWYDQIPSTVTMQKYNAYDILAANYVLKRTSGTHNGITYTWDGDVCTVGGEASNISVNVLKSNDYLPEDVVSGETYYIKYTTTNPQVQLRIMWRDNSDTTLERTFAMGDMPVTVPASATKWTIGLYVEDGVDLDEDVTVSGIAFVSTMTNKELTARVGETGMTGQTYAASLWSWAVIGASFDSGEFNYKLTAYPTLEDAQAQTNGFTYTPEIDDFRYACWDMFKRMNGISDLYIYANGGQNARDWIHPSGASEARKHVYDTDTEELATPNGYYDGNNVWHFYYVHDTSDGWTYNNGIYTKGGNIAPYRTGIGHGGGTWAKMLADYWNGVVKQVFVVNLGSNDINNNYPHNDDWSEKQSYDATKFYTCGEIEDIGTYDLETDTDTVPEGKTEGVVPGVVNSYAAYIGAILNRIIAIQPGALILLCTIRRGFSSPANKAAVWTEYNNMLKAIAADDRYKDNVIVIDNGADGPDYGSAPMTSMFIGYHPNAIGYQYIARFWNTEINNALWANYAKPVIKQGMFIGTGKSF